MFESLSALLGALQDNNIDFEIDDELVVYVSQSDTATILKTPNVDVTEFIEEVSFEGFDYKAVKCLNNTSVAIICLN